MFKHDLQELYERTTEIDEVLAVMPMHRWRIKQVRGGKDEAVHLFNVLSDSMINDGWTVQTRNNRGQGNSAGWCSNRLYEIYVKPTWKNAMFLNLAHESAHAYDFDNFGPIFLMLFGKYGAEVRAESAGYLIAKYCGIGVNNGLLERCADYIAAQRQLYHIDYDDTTIEDSTNDVVRIAEQLLYRMGY